jgi:hypothetical protein
MARRGYLALADIEAKLAMLRVECTPMPTCRSLRRCEADRHMGEKWCMQQSACTAGHPRASPKITTRGGT